MGDRSHAGHFERLQENPSFASYKQKTSLPVLVMPYTRIRGNPVETTLKILRKIESVLDNPTIRGIRTCGSGDALLGRFIRTNTTNEFMAITKGIEFLNPEIKTVFEIGGANSRYLKLEKAGTNGTVGLVDYNKSGDCAAGTGAFLDQQAARLKFKIEDVGQIVSSCSISAKIAGRCSVFAKSDMIHAQQKGYKPEEILKGLCEAVAQNYKSNIVCGKTVLPPVAFVGGVAANSGVVSALRSLFDLSPDQLFVPEMYHCLAALGAAVMELETESLAQNLSQFYLNSVDDQDSAAQIKAMNQPLSVENVLLLQDYIMKNENGRGIVDAYLGLDIGSVSTNLAVIDRDGQVLKSIYTRTAGRPIEVVNDALKEIQRDVGKQINICGVGTTGSGRELIGMLAGADTVNDEITAHKTGADFVGKTMLNKSVDTIFEIGGQDSKYISLENGIVVDFAMNEACAAGTGSFLEERAEELEISIKDQFADLSLHSKTPIRLGERCTVFMERDVTSCQQAGASKEDLTAGLAYSVVYNYLNRVVGQRKIGDVIFFQGGTAYNKAVAAAFSQVLEKQIIVPPYNGVMGAIGVALIARDKHLRTGYKTGFRGYALENVHYKLREFTCKSCTNNCNIQAFTVEGETTYWGDQCSDKYRKRAKNVKQATIEDLIEVRNKLFFEGYDPERKNGRAVIGIPLSMYTYDWLPFWIKYFSYLDFNVVVSPTTNKSIKQQGLEATVAEPCFPITVAHGHVVALFKEKVDHVLLPNLINTTSLTENVNSYLCPWGQTLPFVAANAPAVEKNRDRILRPTMEFGYGIDVVRKSLNNMVRAFGISKKQADNAFELAYERQMQFKAQLYDYGRKILNDLEASGEKAIILVGRPYNIYDKGINLDIPRKIRDYYGVNYIPVDFLDTDQISIQDINANMYWNYGRKVIAAARSIRDKPKLDLIYLTNFKCGPDSYIKHYVSEALGRPFLILQFDEHSNDAGYITRCEAYLTSKGFLQ